MSIEQFLYFFATVLFMLASYWANINAGDKLLKIATYIMIFVGFVLMTIALLSFSPTALPFIGQ